MGINDVWHIGIIEAWDLGADKGAVRLAGRGDIVDLSGIHCADFDSTPYVGKQVQVLVAQDGRRCALARPLFLGIED